jgi:hypothetical protein
MHIKLGEWSLAKLLKECTPTQVTNFGAVQESARGS